MLMAEGELFFEPSLLAGFLMTGRALEGVPKKLPNIEGTDRIRMNETVVLGKMALIKFDVKTNECLSIGE